VFHMGKCPACSKMITHINIEPVEVRQGINAVYNGVSYQCPFCKAVLGAAIDPLALKADTVKQILEGIRKTGR